MSRDVEDIEVDLVLEAVYRRFGYDFRDYQRASLKRRLQNFAATGDAPTIAHLLPRLLHEEGFVDRFVNGISVSVTEPFREPLSLAAIREHVFPVLKTYGYCKLWHAGCSTGEEVYSLAILIEEAGLAGRVQVYATDINTQALAAAREGIYRLEALKGAAENYQRAGGSVRLADYYVAHYGNGKFADRLKERVVFSQHNLATDAAFGEMHLILCRNVLIYFKRELQERVVKLFHGSLARRGFMALGSKESLQFIKAEHAFETINARARLFRAL